jgi:hypothetical protein
LWGKNAAAALLAWDFDGWNNAQASVCEVEETKRRSARLKKELRIR